MTESRMTILVTPAKLNLGLEIVGRREDCYHEVRTILQAVSIYDELLLKQARGFMYKSDPGVSASEDLARPILERAAARHRWSGQLESRKSIPVAAGLGGGSSDAALALRLAAAASGISPSIEDATAVGADVPFFLSGGTALASGIGEELRRLPTPRLWFVVNVPPLAIKNKTRTLFQGLLPEDMSDGTAVERLSRDLGQLTRDGGVRELPNAFLRQMLKHAEVRRAWQTMIDVSGCASLSGAGPSVFSWHGSEAEAEDVAARARELLPGMTFQCAAIPVHSDEATVALFVQQLG